MSNSNNKGKTWAANVRRLNKHVNDPTMDNKARSMSLAEWETWAIRLGRAQQVLRLKAPSAYEKSVEMMVRYCAEDNAGAALVLAHGVVVLSAMLACGTGMAVMSGGGVEGML
jgi:hypothetical protein